MEKERKRERSLREKRGKKSDSLNGSERNFLRTSPSKKKKSLGDEDCCFFPSHPLRARFARRHREPTVRAAPTHRPPTPVPLLRRLSRGETQRCKHGGRASESQRRRRKKSRRREKKKTATSPQSRSLSDRAQKAPSHATPGLTSHAQCNLSCACKHVFARQKEHARAPWSWGRRRAREPPSSSRDRFLRGPLAPFSFACSSFRRVTRETEISPTRPGKRGMRATERLRDRFF